MWPAIGAIAAIIGLYINSKNSNAANQAKNSNLSSGGTPTNTQSGTPSTVQTLANLNATTPIKLAWGPTLGKGTIAPGTPPPSTGAIVARQTTKNESGVYQPAPVLNNTDSNYSNAASSPTNPPFNAVLPKPIFATPILSSGTVKPPSGGAKPVSNAIITKLASPALGFESTTETVGAGPDRVEIAGSPLPAAQRGTFGISTGISWGKL
jgi:hypothetical protein